MNQLIEKRNKEPEF